MPLSFNLEQDATPFFIGFDEFSTKLKNIIDAASTISQEQTDFPSYNMFKLDDYNFVFEIFIPGFSAKDILTSLEGPVLTVTAKREVSYQTATKMFSNVTVPETFTKKFIITDNYKVNEIGYEDGVLHISFLKILPPANRDGNYPTIFKDGITVR